jgi:hypothetical protein
LACRGGATTSENSWQSWKSSRRRDRSGSQEHGIPAVAVYLVLGALPPLLPVWRQAIPFLLQVFPGLDAYGGGTPFASKSVRERSRGALPRGSGLVGQRPRRLAW